MVTPERMKRVLDANPIGRVIVKLGIETHPKGNNMIVNKCPFCGAENVAYVSPKYGIFKCFGCNMSASGTGLVTHVKKCTFEEAIDFLDPAKE